MCMTPHTTPHPQVNLPKKLVAALLHAIDVLMERSMLDDMAWNCLMRLSNISWTSINFNPSINQSINQSSNQSSNQSIHPSIHQSINQSIHWSPINHLSSSHSKNSKKTFFVYQP